MGGGRPGACCHSVRSGMCLACCRCAARGAPTHGQVWPPLWVRVKQHMCPTPSPTRQLQRLLQSSVECGLTPGLGWGAVLNFVVGIFCGLVFGVGVWFWGFGLWHLRHHVRGGAVCRMPSGASFVGGRGLRAGPVWVGCGPLRGLHLTGEACQYGVVVVQIVAPCHGTVCNACFRAFVDGCRFLFPAAKRAGTPVTRMGAVQVKMLVQKPGSSKAVEGGAQNK